VVKKVTLLKVNVVQPEVARAASVVNMVIMLAVAKGNELKVWKTRHHPTSARQTAASWLGETGQSS